MQSVLGLNDRELMRTSKYPAGQCRANCATRLSDQLHSPRAQSGSEIYQGTKDSSWRCREAGDQKKHKKRIRTYKCGVGLKLCKDLLHMLLCIRTHSAARDPEPQKGRRLQFSSGGATPRFELGTSCSYVLEPKARIVPLDQVAALLMHEAVVGHLMFGVLPEGAAKCGGCMGCMGCRMRREVGPPDA